MVQSGTVYSSKDLAKTVCYGSQPDRGLRGVYPLTLAIYLSLPILCRKANEKRVS